MPFRVYNNFGGRIGGPVVKNRTFFFGAYQGSRDQGSVVVAGNVPLPPWRGGDFSGVSRSLANPFTGQPFTGNIIPGNLINGVSQRLQDIFYPAPNFGPPDLQSGNWRGVLKPGLSAFTDFDSFDIRVDHKLREQDTVFATFNYIRMPRTTWQAGSLPPFGLRKQLRQGRSGALSWMHILSPAVINEFRMGVTRQRNDIRSTFIGSDILQQAGIQGVSVAGVPVVPIFNVTGITTAANVPNFVFPDTSFQWTDNVNWTRGSHSMKFGFNAIRDRDSGFFIGGNVYGVYNFTGASTGFPYGDFLLGLPQTTQRVNPTPQRHRFGNWWAAYFQDQYKVTPRLTLNYGLRWEAQEPYHDNRGLLGSFDLRSGALVIPDEGVRHINPLFPKTIPIITASQAGYPKDTLLDFRSAYFYPRFGFAYRPFGDERTVVRGGYGVYGSTIYPAMTLAGGPFSGSETFTNRIVNNAPLFSFPRPFLEAGALPAQNAQGVDPRLRVPYSQQWNLTVERQVGEVGISVAYVGTRSVNLIYGRNLNQLAPGTAPFSPSRFLYPLYNSVIWYENGGNQIYNSLQVAARKAYGKNLFFNTGWTWAKSLTDTQDQTSFAGPIIENAFDRRAERADSTLTSTHRFYTSVIYALPIGRSQRYLASLNRPLEGLLGGWRMAWNVLAQSGQFFTPGFSGFDPSNTNNFGGRPDRVAGASTGPAGGRSIQQWFNPAAFKIPGCPDSEPVCRAPANIGRFGNSALNVLRAPRVVNFDLAVMKQFAIRESKQLLFRVSATNVFNHPNFSTPAANIISPGTVGRITSTYGELPGTRAREVDFMLRLEF